MDWGSEWDAAEASAWAVASVEVSDVEWVVASVEVSDVVWAQVWVAASLTTRRTARGTGSNAG